MGSSIPAILRLGLLLAPVALTPMLLQAYGERVSEQRLRARIHRSLARRRAFGAGYDLRADLDARRPGSFRKMVLQRQSKVVVMAYGTAVGAYPGRRLMGCLDHRSGELVVQRGFASEVPPACLEVVSRSNGPGGAGLRPAAAPPAGARRAA